MDGSIENGKQMKTNSSNFEGCVQPLQVATAKNELQTTHRNHDQGKQPQLPKQKSHNTESSPRIVLTTNQDRFMVDFVSMYFGLSS